MRHLQYCQTIRLDVTSDKNSFNFDHAAALFKIMNAFTKSTLNEQEFDTHLLNYHPENLFLAAELCLKKWLWELTKADEITVKYVACRNSLFHF